MRFVLDENIPKDLAGWLKDKGHQTLSIPKGISDEEVAGIVKKEGLALLTLDRHFANTLKFPPKEFPGIVRIKIHPSYTEDISFSLGELFKLFPNPEDLSGKLFILEKDGFFKVKE